MDLETLIKEIGQDNIQVQSIESSTVKIADKKRTADTEITIATNQINTNQFQQNSGKVGLIIWMDGEKARKLLS